MTETFSDMNEHNRCEYKGKAAKEFCDFCNEHPYIKIIFVAKRRRYISYCGNGDEYYDIDLIYSADSKHCEKNYFGRWELK